MKKFIVAVSVAGLGAAGLLAPQALSAAPPASGAPASSPIKWEPCTQEPLKGLGAECGFVEAPLDYANPDGEKVQIAVSRVKHKTPDAQYQGPMLINPGGPGGSGLAMPIISQRVPNHAADAYDWIGFDPRGVGASKPALSCDPNYLGYNRPEYVPTTPEIEKANLDRANSYADKCGKAGGKLLDHIKTVDNVKDMDTIRKALGSDQINYYGFSYGTYIGQVYATLFPQNLRRVVLDGVMDHRNVFYQANLNQDVAFEKDIRIFFDWVAQYNDTFKLGKTGAEVMDRYYKDKDKLAKQPAGGKIGSSEFADLFLPAGYRQRAWDGIARAWSNWALHNDVDGLVKQYDSANGPGNDNMYAIYAGTQCTDTQWPKNWEKWKQDNWKTSKEAPFYTWANAWYNVPCLYWPAPAGKAVNVNPKDAPPTLLLSEELDGATPFEGALEARRIFPGSVLISTPEGTTHSNSLRGNSCVDDRIAEYLTTGKLPDRKPGKNIPDLQCKALPKPVPAQPGMQTMSNHKDPTEVSGRGR